MAKPRPSASVILFRAPQQVFLARRSADQRFYPNFYSFIGGGIQEEDRKLARQQLDGMLPQELASEMVAAVREVFEETGILLAEPLLSPQELAPDRARLLSGETSFGDILERYQLRLIPELLTPLGRKTTPSFFPIRYQTRFFLVQLPPSVEPQIWPGELSKGQWFHLPDLLDQWRRRQILIPPPVVVLLQKLQECQNSWSPLCWLDDDNLADSPFLIPISPGVRLLPLTTPTVPPAEQVNCYFIGEERFFLLDPGTELKEEQEHLAEALQMELQKGAQCVGILLTHYHRDHVGAVEFLRRHFSLPLYAHPLTAHWLAQKGISLAIDTPLKEGQTLSESDAGELQVIHTPGHSPDHCAFLLEKHCLFAGDLVSTISSILVPPRPKGDLSAYIRSLYKVLALEFTWLLPGHGFPTTEGKALLKQYLEHRKSREEQVLQALREGHCHKHELLERVYGGEIPPSLYEYAAMNLESMLEKLETEGRVEFRADRYEITEDGTHVCRDLSES